jgi:colanic acid biosynthesis glycosyl transferase WcaI
MSDKRLSVLFLAQYFYPEVPATAQLSTDLALGLTEHGFSVTVYTGQPSYWRGQRLPSSEGYKGVDIHRSYSRRLSREGTSTRLFNGAIVALVTFFKLLSRKKYDVTIVDSTSPFLVVVALLLWRVRRIPYVFWVQDVYPEIAIELGVIKNNSLVHRLWAAAYSQVYRDAARIVVLGTAMRDVVRRSLRPSDFDNCVEIPNWAHGDDVVPRAPADNPMRRELGLEDKLVVLYSGNMGLVHDLETVMDAIERLHRLKDVRFLLIGDGGKRDWIEETIAANDLKNVIVLPYQPEERLPLSLTCGDLSLVTLRKGMEGLSVPSKIYSSLAAGLGILAVVGKNSEIAEIVERNGCGVRVSQGDVDALVEAIETLHADRELLHDMKRKSRIAFERDFTRTKSVESYMTLLRAVVNRG